MCVCVCVCMYIYIFLPSPHILKHIKHSSKNLLLKALSYGRHIFIMLKALPMKGILMECNITYI